jgi:hypothetical protein
MSRKPRTAAEYIFENLEAQYEQVRAAEANGQASPEELEAAAELATQAATILAVKKKWVLPFL